MKVSAAKLIANRRNLQLGRQKQKTRRMKIVCSNCKSEFTTPRCWEGRKKYCSNACRYQHKVADHASNWRGGVDHSKRPNSGENLKWRRAVIARSNGRCEYCFAKAPLIAHHRMRYAYFPLLRYDLSNGEALCLDCHRRVHRPELNFRGLQTYFPFA